jgi:hypothetical protein
VTDPASGAPDAGICAGRGARALQRSTLAPAPARQSVLFTEPGSGSSLLDPFQYVA